MGLCFVLCFISTALGQSGQTVRTLRLKLSAGDLPSAESILEVHRLEKGEDAEYIQGIAWLARGSLLVGDFTAASRYAKQAAALSKPYLKESGAFDTAPEAVYALGTAIEVEAQCRLAAQGKREALQYLKNQQDTYSNAPIAFRSRLQKRWNLIGLEGTRAPDFTVEDHLGPLPPSLRELSGKPVVLFFWAEWCGHCKSQAAALRRVVEKYQPRGVEFVAPTRFYDSDRVSERLKIEQVWRDSYPGLQSVSVPISEQAMLRYGVAATPTFVLLDRKGIVRLYSPTRMTEERLSGAIDGLLGTTKE